MHRSGHASRRTRVAADTHRGGQAAYHSRRPPHHSRRPPHHPRRPPHQTRTAADTYRGGRASHQIHRGEHIPHRTPTAASETRTYTSTAAATDRGANRQQRAHSLRSARAAVRVSASVRARGEPHLCLYVCGVRALRVRLVRARRIADGGPLPLGTRAPHRRGVMSGAAAATAVPCRAHASHRCPPSATSRGMLRRRRRRGCARRPVSPPVRTSCRSLLSYPTACVACIRPIPRRTILRGDGSGSGGNDHQELPLAQRVRRTANAPVGGRSGRRMLCPILSGEYACTSTRRQGSRRSKWGGVYGSRTVTAAVAVCRDRPTSVTATAAAAAVPCARRGVRQRTCAAQSRVCVCVRESVRRRRRCRCRRVRRGMHRATDMDGAHYDSDSGSACERSRAVCVSVDPVWLVVCVGRAVVCVSLCPSINGHVRPVPPAQDGELR